MVGGVVSYRLWVNEARTVLVRMWENGTVEVATREHPSHTWGPPVRLAEEKASHEALRAELDALRDVEAAAREIQPMTEGSEGAAYTAYSIPTDRMIRLQQRLARLDAVRAERGEA